jgi:hypothetical protein
MFARLLAHLRGHWMGALALFLALTGGVAYTANAIFSEDIVDGGTRSADVYSLSGRGIDGTVCVTTASTGSTGLSE